MTRRLNGTILIKGKINQPVNAGWENPIVLPRLSNADMTTEFPAADWPDSMCFAVSQTRPAYSDGTNWRHVITNAIIV